MMKWIGRHKILAYLIISTLLLFFVTLLTGGGYEKGEAIAKVVLIGLVLYLPIIWIYSWIKKGHNVK